MARHFTVRTGHQVLAYTDGVLTGVRGPGRYRPTRRTQYQLVDIREMIMTVTGQEVPTSDGINVKVSVTVAAARVGIAVHDLVIEDIVLPADLRQGQAEQVTARQRGLAKLEPTEV